MNDDAWRFRRRRRIGNGVSALALSAALLGVLGAGAGGVPALGRMLVPGHGAWDWRFTLLPAMTRPVGHGPALAERGLAVPGSTVPAALAGPVLASGARVGLARTPRMSRPPS
jgi:hypothetical protein